MFAKPNLLGYTTDDKRTDENEHFVWAKKNPFLESKPDLKVTCAKDPFGYPGYDHKSLEEAFKDLDNVVDKCVNDLVLSRERMFFEALAVFGYSRGWAMNNRDKVKIVEVPPTPGYNSNEQVFVNDEFLFSMVGSINFDKHLYKIEIKFNLGGEKQ